MQSVEVHYLEQLDKDLAKVLRESKASRRELHEQIAEAAKKAVDGQIAEATKKAADGQTGGGLNDEHGKIRRWQVKHVGTGGGYAAVRPVGGITGRDSPGAITNYLENGHKIRPAGKTKSRLNVAYVDGRHFYQESQSTVEAEAIKLAEAFAERLADMIEGG